MKLQSLNYLLLLVSFFLLILASSFPYKAKGSLPPLEDSPNTFLSGHFPDPFCVLDHIPFRVDKHEKPPSPHYIDWKETSEEHVITMDVPGLRKDEIKIEVEENGVLRVSSERKKEEERKDDHWHRVERYYGKFWRQVRLPGNVDLDSIKAKIENGVLTLTLNKFSNCKMKAPRIVSINKEEDDI